MTEPIMPTTLLLESWRAQKARWPHEGRHVLAQFAVQPPAGMAFDPTSIECVVPFLRERRLGVVQWCTATRAGPGAQRSGTAN